MIYIIDPNLKDHVGHYLEYDRSVARAAEDTGSKCIVLANRSIDASKLSDLSVAPVYSNDIWHCLPQNEYHSKRNLKHTNAQFASETLQFFADAPLNAGDILFMPTITKAQLSGAASIVERLVKTAVRFEIMLRYQREMYEGPVAESAFRQLEAASQICRIQLSTDSHRLVRELAFLTKLEIKVYPIPHTDMLEGTRRSRPSGAVHLISLGNARGEKGLAEILSAIQRCGRHEWADQVHFTVQCNNPSDDVREVISNFKTDGSPRTTLIDRELDTAEYYSLLRSADVILTPYHRDTYAARTSGIFLEAVTAAKIVICTHGTWMSDLLSVFNNGIAINDRSVTELVSAIGQTTMLTSELQKAADEASRHWSRIHTPSNLVSHLLGAPETSAEIPGGRRAAIIYPWGDVIDGRGGAVMRLKLFVRYLEDHYDEIRVLFPGRGRVCLSAKASADSYDDSRWHKHVLRRVLENLTASLLHTPKDRVFHLWNHIWPRLDRAFQRRCSQIVHWADDVFLEYSYFAPVVADACAVKGKKFTLTQYDILSEMSRNVPLIHLLTRKLEFQALRLASKVVVATRHDQEICERQGIPAVLIPHPIDAQAKPFLSEEDAHFLIEHFLGVMTRGKTVCFFVGGNYGPNRRAAEAVRGFAKAMDSDLLCQNVVFLVAGECMTPQATVNFQSLGRLEDVLLAAVYKICSVVLIPLEEGTGSSIKSIEALVSGALILSTSVGMRGLAAESGVHCYIEDDLAQFPNRIKVLVRDCEANRLVRRRARQLGEAYDYRTVFAKYGVIGNVGGAQSGYVRPPVNPFAELTKRIVGLNDPAAVQFLCERIDTAQLPLADLAVLTIAQLTASPHDARTQAMITELESHADVSMEGLFNRWSFYHSCGQLEKIRRSARDRFALITALDRHQLVLEVRQNLWSLFNGGKFDAVEAISQAFCDARPDNKDGEIFYLLALSNAMSGGAADRSITYFSAAIEAGFDAGWSHYHRGRLLVSLGDRRGFEDLERAKGLGGRAGEEARKHLVEKEISVLWAHYFSGRHARAERKARRLMSSGLTDPVLDYVLALSLDAQGKRIKSAIRHLDIAIDKGFEPGWTHYHRGRLRLKLRDRRGVADLRIAHACGGEPGALSSKELELLGEDPRWVPSLNVRGHARKAHHL